MEMLAVGFNFDRSKKAILYEIKEGNMGKDKNGKRKRYTTIELCTDRWQAGLEKPKPRHYPIRSYPGCYICGVQHKSDKLGTDDKNKVTCKNCIDELKKDNFYCEEHGFIEVEDVTNDEKCVYCGRDV